MVVGDRLGAHAAPATGVDPVAVVVDGDVLHRGFDTLDGAQPVGEEVELPEVARLRVGAGAGQASDVGRAELHERLLDDDRFVVDVLGAHEPHTLDPALGPEPAVRLDLCLELRRGEPAVKRLGLPGALAPAVEAPLHLVADRSVGALASNDRRHRVTSHDHR